MQGTRRYQVNVSRMWSEGRTFYIPPYHPRIQFDQHSKLYSFFHKIPAKLTRCLEHFIMAPHSKLSLGNSWVWGNSLYIWDSFGWIKSHAIPQSAIHCHINIPAIWGSYDCTTPQFCRVVPNQLHCKNFASVQVGILMRSTLSLAMVSCWTSPFTKHKMSFIIWYLEEDIDQHVYKQFTSADTLLLYRGNL